MTDINENPPNYKEATLYAQPINMATAINECADDVTFLPNFYPYEKIAIMKTFLERHFHYFLIDDSGSMMTYDGRVFNNGIETKCSRWTEICNDIKIITSVAHKCAIKFGSLSAFKFLNIPQVFYMGRDHDNNITFSNIIRILETVPTFTTPLVSNLTQVIEDIKQRQLMDPNFVGMSTIIIFSDGLDDPIGKTPHNVGTQQLINFFNTSDTTLKIKFIIRLATNDSNVVNAWNAVDNITEIDIDILDDLVSEAIEVEEKNGEWLTYNYTFHIIRTIGANKLFDLLDEQTLCVNDRIKIAEHILNTVLPKNQMDLMNYLKSRGLNIFSVTSMNQQKLFRNMFAVNGTKRIKKHCVIL